MKNYLSLISTKTKLKCLGVLLLSVFGSILASVWPVKLGDLYTDISSGVIATLAQGATAIAIFGFTYLTAECISILRRIMLDRVITDHEAEIRQSSIEKLLKMPVSYYSDSLSGEKNAEINQGVAGLSQLIKIMCNDVFSTILTAIFTLVQVLLNAPAMMVGIIVMYLVLTLCISLLQIRSQNGMREKIIAQKNTLDGQVCQSLSNLEMIRSMNAEGYEKRRLVPNILNISRTEKRHQTTMGTFDCIKQACKIAFQIIILVVSVVLMQQGKMEGGAVITVCLLFQQLVKPIDDVYRFMDDTASSVVKAKVLLKVTFSKADEIFDIQPSGTQASGNEITLHNVVVTNPEKTKALAMYEDISIPADGKVALRGPNGCGKTSLIRCIDRYYPHSEGQISVFGKDLGEYTQKDLSEAFFYTPQTSFFIAGTVRDNLLYGLDREVSDEELADALEKVHLTGSDHSDTVIRKDPEEALEFKVGEKAEELSGGMKQRLSLARAFLRHPRMYVFDEITANLDQGATNYVLTNIEAHANAIGAGIVYITHDQNVVDRCDRVITLENKLRDKTPVQIEKTTAQNLSMPTQCAKQPLKNATYARQTA